MPRPKSDRKMVAFKLGDLHRAMLREMAKDRSTPTQSDVIRHAIEEMYERRQRKTQRKMAEAS